MSREIRHSIYDRIIHRLEDNGWHDVRMLDEVTSYPQYWLESLRRDPKFDVDDRQGRLRLLPCRS